MDVVTITDPGDQRVALYLDVRDRDRIGRDGAFVAEGEVVLRALLGPRSRFRPMSLLVAADRAPALLPTLPDLPGLPVFVAAPAIMDRIAGFPIHRGILAIGSTGEPLSASEMLAAAGPDALVVATLGIANHDNVGGIFRNAAAFGAAGVLLDGHSCHPLYRKAIRVSTGSALTMPFARLAPGVDAITVLVEAGFEVLALSPRGEMPLAETRPSGRTAVLLGTEGQGLPAAILARVKTVRIPMAEGVDSLNVAVTSGIVLHHLASFSAR
ncbi:MAG: RNA methyltransferase [Bauldia sp.]|nr:RNA methyltransferase [Bauldia sp.]